MRRAAGLLLLGALTTTACGSGHAATATNPIPNGVNSSTSTPSKTTSPPSIRTVPTATATAPTPTTTTVAPLATYEVVTRDETWVDPSRSTGSVTNGRSLPTELFIPAVNGSPALRYGPFPLFVWAHGLDATVSYFAPMLRAWAARGYVVAAPTFPLTNADVRGGGVFGDYVNQPADVRFVIDRILAYGGPGGSGIAGLVDPARIAVGGHSLGAVTTRGLTANRCCLDPRVKAAIEIDGSDLRFPNGAFVQRPVPTLWIHGDADTTFDVSQSRSMYARAANPKFLVVMHGMPHTAFKIPRAGTEIVNVVGDFLDAYVRNDAGAVGRLLRDATAISGFATVSSQP